MTVLLSQATWAQLKIGPVGGISVNQIKFGKLYSGADYSANPKLGYRFGGIVDYNFSSIFSLHTELLYSHKGKILKLPTDKYFKHTASYNFIELPVLLRVGINKPIGGNRKKMMAYGNIGPQFSYWVSGKGKLTAGQSAGRTGTYSIPYQIEFGEQDPDYEVLYVSDANRFILGLDFGGGVLIPFRKDELLMVDVRLSMGTTFMGRGAENPVSFSEFNENYLYTNNTLSISLGYVFDLDLHEFRRGKSKTKK